MKYFIHAGVTILLLSSVAGCDLEEARKKAAKVWRDFYGLCLEADKEGRDYSVRAFRDRAATDNGFEDWDDFVEKAKDVLPSEDWLAALHEAHGWYKAEQEKFGGPGAAIEARARKVWKGFFSKMIEGVRKGEPVDADGAQQEAAREQGFENWDAFCNRAVQEMGAQAWMDLVKEMSAWYEKELKQAVEEMARGAGDGAREEAGEEPPIVDEAFPGNLRGFDASLCGTFLFEIHSSDGRKIADATIVVDKAPPGPGVYLVRMEIDAGAPLNHRSDQTVVLDETLACISTTLVLEKEGSPARTQKAVRREGFWRYALSTEDLRCRIPARGKNHGEVLAQLLLARKADLSSPGRFTLQGITWPNSLEPEEMGKTLERRDIFVTLEMTVPGASSYQHAGEVVKAHLVRFEKEGEAQPLVVAVAPDRRILAFWGEGAPIRYVATKAEPSGRIMRTPRDAVSYFLEAAKEGAAGILKAKYAFAKSVWIVLENAPEKEDDGDGVVSFEIREVAIDGSEAKVHARVEEIDKGEEKETEMSFWLRIEDGSWGIYKFKHGDDEETDFDQVAKTIRQMKEDQEKRPK